MKIPLWSMLRWQLRPTESWRARLVTGGTKAIAIQLSGTLLIFAVNILMARAAGIQGYGVYSFVIACAGFAAVFGRLGLDTAAVRFVPEYLVAGTKSALRGLLRSSVGLVAVASLLGALGVGAVFLLVNRWTPNGRDGILIAVFFLVPALSFTSLAQGFLRGMGWIGRSYLGDYIIRPLLLGAFVAISWKISGSVLAYRAVLLLAAAAWCLAAAIAWVWVLRSFSQKTVAVTPATYAVGHWLSVALPLFGIGALNMTLARADTLLVGALTNDREVGYYAAASRIAYFISFGLAALNTVAAPMMAEMYATSRTGELKALITTVIRLGSLGGVIAIVVFLTFGRPLLGIFGAGFEQGWLPLLVLAVGQVVNVSVGPLGYLLAMTGSHREALWILVQGAVLNLVVGVAGVLLWGAVGAALATSIAMIWWNVAMLRHVGERFEFFIIPFYGVR